MAELPDRVLLLTVAVPALSSCAKKKWNRHIR
jgi:hypothetical protein